MPLAAPRRVVNADLAAHIASLGIDLTAVEPALVDLEVKSLDDMGVAMRHGILTIDALEKYGVKKLIAVKLLGGLSRSRWCLMRYRTL